jgi:hypothetical protein
MFHSVVIVTLLLATAHAQPPGSAFRSPHCGRLSTVHSQDSGSIQAAALDLKIPYGLALSSMLSCASDRAAEISRFWVAPAARPGLLKELVDVTVSSVDPRVADALATTIAVSQNDSTRLYAMVAMTGQIRGDLLISPVHRFVGASRLMRVERSSHGPRGRGALDWTAATKSRIVSTLSRVGRSASSADEKQGARYLLMLIDWAERRQ